MISEAFMRAAAKAEEILEGMASPVDLNDTELLVKIATTSLNSKVILLSANFTAPRKFVTVRVYGALLKRPGQAQGRGKFHKHYRA